MHAIIAYETTALVYALFVFLFAKSVRNSTKSPYGVEISTPFKEIGSPGHKN